MYMYIANDVNVFLVEVEKQNLGRNLSCYAQHSLF